MDSSTIAIDAAGILISALISFLVASFRVGEYKNKVDNACNTIENLQEEMREVRDKAIAAETLLNERGPLTKRKSPVDLTERGLKILTDSGGKKFVDENYAEFKKSVEATNPATSYDIQEKSREVFGNVENDVRLNPIKEYLFKEGLELENIVEVLGIYLRNKILEERGIKIEDINNKK